MQHEKLYNAQSKAYLNYVIVFVFTTNKNRCDQFLPLRKDNLLREREVSNKLFVNCRAFHTVSCSIFCFSLRKHSN